MTTPVKATILDEDHFRLLSIPFDGMVPSPFYKRGADLDGQSFPPDVDIKRDWLPSRLVDFHHRSDPLLRDAIVGKAVYDDEPEEDGWWAEIWLNKQKASYSRLRTLVQRGVDIYGSTEAVPSLVRMRLPNGNVVPWKANTAAELIVWPVMRQTLSPDPRNFMSTPALKASLDAYAAEGIAPTASFFDDLARYLDDLASTPSGDLTGEPPAKAGRILAARNESRLRESLSDMEKAGWDPTVRKRALAQIAAVLAEAERYLTSTGEPG